MTSTSTKPLVVVVGADGFVGGGLARALGARRVVYGPCREDDVHVSQAAELLRSADVVVNAGGFRVRPGCNDADYRRSHQGATAVFVPWIRKGARMIHISSASVLGTGQHLGNGTPPNPATFPSPSYATAKLEQDGYLATIAAERGFKVILLRPAVVYSAQGAGMIDTMLRLAQRGVALRLYPRGARHHLCNMDLLAEVTRRVIERDDLPHMSCFVVADPYTVENRELESLIRGAVQRPTVTVPLPLPWMTAVLRRGFRSSVPRLDLRTRGEIFGVLHMDTVYDPSESFERLGIDPASYAIEKTLLPVIQRTLRA
jgi:nucleoside-diphosphate-sugar epimerase